MSHAAPYSHFADKQALIAAISTAGYARLYDVLRRVTERYEGDPSAQLIEGAWAYVRFALEEIRTAAAGNDAPEELVRAITAAERDARIRAID